jgi:class 3 adenylate cyclase
VQSQSLTIVFIDIQEYTSRTSGTSREANERLLARFDALVKPLVKAYSGKVIKSLGDAFLLTFISPTDSLLCAMAVQDQLARSNAGQPEEDRFQVRAAVNAGEVRLDGGDVFGEAVNITARIEGLAPGGEIWFSEVVYMMMNKSEIPAVEVGMRQLKGIPEPVRLFRVPRVAEVGDYRLQGSHPGSTGAGPAETHPLEPAGLPFGGAALERVQSSLPGHRNGRVKPGLGAAFSDLHHLALVRSARRGRHGGLHAWLAPFSYALFWMAGFLGLAASGRLLARCGASVGRGAQSLRSHAHLTLRTGLTLGLLCLVTGATAGLLHHETVLVQRAEIQRVAAEKRAAAAKDELRMQKRKSLAAKKPHHFWD